MKQIIYLNQRKIMDHIEFRLSTWPKVDTAFKRGRLGTIEFLLSVVLAGVPGIVKGDFHEVSCVIEDFVYSLANDGDYRLSEGLKQELKKIMFELIKEVGGIVGNDGVAFGGGRSLVELDAVIFLKKDLMKCIYI